MAITPQGGRVGGQAELVGPVVEIDEPADLRVTTPHTRNVVLTLVE